MKKINMSLIIVSQIILGLGVSSNAVAAAKPIAGVSCNDGFFVRTPDKHVHWINDKTEEHIEVYDQNDDIYAMAQCGTGVITVFEKQVNGEQEYNVIYSPNCMDIGSEKGLSSQIYKGKEKINRIDAKDGKLEIRFVNKTYLRGESCDSVHAD